MLSFGPEGVDRRIAVTADVEGAPFDGSQQDAALAVRERLESAVARRLRSDVAVGCYLSGGLDSAIVTSLAARQSAHPVRTFSVGFADPAYDESGDQKRLAEWLGTRHTALRVTTEDLAETFPAAVRAAEMPLFRTAVAPMLRLSRTVRDHDVEVVLTGEGADETFLGYDLFKEAILRDRWHQLPSADRMQRISELYREQPHFRAGGAALAAVFEAHSGNREDDLFSHRLRIANGAFAQRLLAERQDGVAKLREWTAAHQDVIAELDLMRRAQWLEISTLLTGYLLSSQGDRMAFANGVEPRCPFLDRELTALAARLPVAWRIEDACHEKAILRHAFDGLLPDWVLRKAKRPYVAPDAALIAGGYARACRQTLLAPTELARIGVLDRTFAGALVDRLVAAAADRIGPRESQAFLLLVSLVVLDRFFVRRQADAPVLRGTLAVAVVERDPGASGADQARR